MGGGLTAELVLKRRYRLPPVNTDRSFLPSVERLRDRRPRSVLVALLAAAAVAGAAIGVFVISGGGPGSATAAGTSVRSAPPPVPTAVAAPREERAPSAAARNRGTTPVTITAVGDITLGTTPTLPRGGPLALLSGVAEWLRGDVVLGNLETTLSAGAGSKCGSDSSNCYAFQAPPGYAGGLKRVGFTMLNLANNHSFDFGAGGFEQTVTTLRRAGIKTIGAIGQVAFTRVGDTRVAVLGFAPNSRVQSLLDIPAAVRLVRKADRRADVVIVTFHGGAEGASATRVRPGMETYLGELRGDLVAFSHEVVDAGADLVLGHGPHVLRGMEWYRGRLIAYSLGNFSSYRNLNTSGPGGVSAILTVTLQPDGRWSRGSVVPVALQGAGAPVVDASRAGIATLRKLSRKDFRARGARLTKAGAIVAPSSALPPKIVKRTQKQLSRLGYYEGAIDGDYGPGTSAAVRAFQRDAGIKVDGVYGSQTKSALSEAARRSS